MIKSLIHSVLYKNRSFLKNLVCWSFLLHTLFFMSACSILTGRVFESSSDSIEAQSLISVLKNKNDSLKSFKGIGKIKLWNKNGSMSTRMAWLGAEPVNLRIAIFGALGQPAESMASDGKWFYFLSHAHQQFKKIRSADPNLKRMISISVKSSDIIALLGGRVPIQAHHSASIIKDRAGYVLLLKTRLGTVREKVFMDESKTDVRKIEIFDTFGFLVWRAEFDRMQNIKGYQIPFLLRVSNDDGAGFQLHINRYWPAVAISPLKFVLNPIAQ